jgi:putative ABC transport system permease protein
MEEFFGVIAMDDLVIIMLVAVGLILLLLAVLGLRNRVMLKLGLRNISRRRAQTVLIVVGLMLSTLIIAAAFGTGDTMSHSFRALALDGLGQVDEVIGEADALSFMNIEFETDGSSRTGQTRLQMSRFEWLADKIAQEQAAGDARALLIEGLTPVISAQIGPVINHTARQTEPLAGIVGYEATTADAFDELFSTDGRRVRIADLGPNEVYIGEQLAKQLAVEPGQELEVFVARGRTPMQATVRAVVKAGGLPGFVIAPLATVQNQMGRGQEIDAILVSNIGGPYEGRKHSGAVSGYLEDLLNDGRINIQKSKQNAVFAAELLGGMFTTIFIGIGSFSIAAALLLVFLIFVMLAAERKQEMGMARAVGTRRRHLVQMFVYEGTAYDLVAAAVGALLGAVVGMVTVGLISRSLEGIGDLGGFHLSHHVEPRSLIVAYCLGVLLTFATVAVSSWRVSRLNIVSAIRDLPPPAQPDEGLRELFLQPWRYLVDAFRQLVRLRLHRTLKRLFWDGPMSSLAFFWALIGRGPLTILIGVLFVFVGNQFGNLFSFNLGVSLVLIGIGLTLRWVMLLRHVRPSLRDRVAFTFIGVSLLVFWSLPFDALDFLGLGELTAGPEMFVLAGVMMVAGAVWTIVYNSDLLLGVVNRLLSPFSNLLPVLRTAIAYPMYNKFRTGLTIAMFALVIFMLVFMAVFVNMINELIQVEEFADLAAYDIRANVLQDRPVGDLQAAIAASEGLDPTDFVEINRQSGYSAGFYGASIPSTVYEIKLADGADATATAQALESAFAENGMVAVAVKDQIQMGLDVMNPMFQLMQAFMGLGLVVGSASIGIVSTRSVVERRQQIGVLRAIGYKSWMIQWSFLLEASFVALLGILVGIALGLILAYNFFNGEMSTGTGAVFSFEIPWTTLGAVTLFAYAVSMLTTYLPSWQAGRIYPAEALRYE